MTELLAALGVAAVVVIVIGIAGMGAYGRAEYRRGRGEERADWMALSRDAQAAVDRAIDEAPRTEDHGEALDRL